MELSNQQVADLAKFASEDLVKYLSSASSQTTESEIQAWQAGYIAGITRGSEQIDT